MIEFLKKVFILAFLVVGFLHLCKITAINLQKNNEKDQVLKEIYDSINYAILVSSNTDKPIKDWEWHHYDTEFSAEYILKKRILPYLTNYKLCENKALRCVDGFSYLNKEDYEHINFRRTKQFARAVVGIYDAHIAFAVTGECRKNRKNSVCGILIVDINNKDAPNTMGYDVFKFAFYGDGSFLPYGFYWPKKDIEEECSEGFSGESCAAKIMLDGWTMKKGSDKPYFIYKK